MKSAIRRYDAIGRYGGEEFLILLPGSDGEAARVQAERVREALAASPFASGADFLPVTCSIGASWRARPAVSDTDSLVREADLALYRAKDRGRNCVEVTAAEPVAAGQSDLPSLAFALTLDRH